ncbi:hypothetical protein [Nocardiopsis ansamitocini]|uniref:Uncharacterized protein n=1 Tax=Nocardiopsis ansamitocini TaxID=1670832 RepID=A0A9W6UII7_9ACTN|nr:hypothetical protein [Nocardiopsis ansamitocini]GLU47749.1 hypothetical protein Nans01_21000 [Nocardiopsis ansamitocini]
MDVIVSWLVGSVSWFALKVAGTVAVVWLASPEELSSFEGAVLWNGGIGFVCYLLVAVVAGLAHRAPERRRLGRNALAVLGAPVLLTLLDGALTAVAPDPDPALFLACAVISLLGAVAGWLLVRAARRS